MAKEKILIVEDEEDIQELVQYNLKKEGYQITGVVTGEEAIEQATSTRPDLIILEALSQAMLLPTFEKLGVPIIAVRAASLDDIKQGLTILGQVIDTNEAAAQAITQ